MRRKALIAVDVNTGRNKGAGDWGWCLETNLEAAAEVAPSNFDSETFGASIVVDFIDMRSRKDQQAVYKVVKDRDETGQGQNPGDADLAARAP